MDAFQARSLHLQTKKHWSNERQFNQDEYYSENISAYLVWIFWLGRPFREMGRCKTDDDGGKNNALHGL